MALITPPAASVLPRITSWATTTEQNPHLWSLSERAAALSIGSLLFAVAMAGLTEERVWFALTALFAVSALFSGARVTANQIIIADAPTS